MSSIMVDIKAASFPLAAHTKSTALLKQLSGTPKLTGVTPASRLEIRPAPDQASSGITQIDVLTGGLPRGCLTEICGPDCSGRTSLLLSALAAATRREEICALIDSSDAFHPHSAAAAGINLERLLWIDRKSTRLNSSHGYISYAVFCLKKKKTKIKIDLKIQNKKIEIIESNTE